ncbi:MAG: LapA family protein [Azonexus sp.]|jgi:uncharacterized integral membrane protein|nr:LapA family protein [Azonexus sp.]
MTALTWAIRLIIFFFLVVFAVQNTAPVTLKLFLGQSWEEPLVIVLLVFFAGGAVIGALSLVGALYRQRREITRLKKQLGEMARQTPPELPPPAA